MTFFQSKYIWSADEREHNDDNQQGRVCTVYGLVSEVIKRGNILDTFVNTTEYLSFFTPLTYHETNFSSYSIYKRNVICWGSAHDQSEGTLKVFQPFSLTPVRKIKTKN